MVTLPIPAALGGVAVALAVAVAVTATVTVHVTQQSDGAACTAAFQSAQAQGVTAAQNMLRIFGGSATDSATTGKAKKAW